MPLEYEHAVFVSYKRDTASHAWAENHFVPKLELYLQDYLPGGHLKSVFFDQQSIRAGMKWPDELQRALKRSRVLVPLFCPSYFSSASCMCELRSMEEREKFAPKRKDGRPAALVYPIEYTPNDHFPPFSSAWTQRCNMVPWSCEEPVFSDNNAYFEFTTKMKTVAKEIADMVLAAPTIRSDFPIVLDPTPIKPPPMKLPRLRKPRRVS